MKINNLYGKNCQHGYRPYETIKYIVIHYTGVKGDTAKGEANFFHNTGRDGVGAHFFVDSDGIIFCSVPINQIAYSVGGVYNLNGYAGEYYTKCTNSNSVSIEMCNATESVTYAQMKAIKWLVKHIQNKCSNANTIIRHWDVNGKLCPAPMASNDNYKWKELKHFINYGYLYKAKVIKNGLIHTSQKAISTNVCGKLKKGEIVRVKAIFGKWSLLVSETSNGKKKWVANSKLLKII